MGKTTSYPCGRVGRHLKPSGGEGRLYGSYGSSVGSGGAGEERPPSAAANGCGKGNGRCEVDDEDDGCGGNRDGC